MSTCHAITWVEMEKTGNLNAGKECSFFGFDCSCCLKVRKIQNHICLFEENFFIGA